MTLQPERKPSPLPPHPDDVSDDLAPPAAWTGVVDAAQVGDKLVQVWLDIDEALHPIFGRRGVAALYHRSITLAARKHPWLQPAQLGALETFDAAPLKAAFGPRTLAEAQTGGEALLQSFRSLLASLVGPSLTARLLRPVWSQAANATSPKEPSP